MCKLFSMFLFATILVVGGCSDSIEPFEKLDKAVDQRGYYYEGEITLANAENDNEVYRITQPMMYPMLYGYVIPIPVPDYDSNIRVNMGENTIVEKNSVRFTVDGVEYLKDMPETGRLEYEKGFSITRISDNEFSVFIDPQCAVDYGEICILMTPKPYMAFDDSPNASSADRFQKFESPDDFNLPTNIDLQFMPYTFTDSYRPIRQYHMIVY